MTDHRDAPEPSDSMEVAGEGRPATGGQGADPSGGGRPVTGGQYTIRRGEASVTVGAVAAVLRDYSVAGTRYTETWPHLAPTPHASGIVLAPWPNRVADGRWTWQGTAQQLDIDEVGAGNAIHGLLRDTAYQVTDLAPHSVTLAAPIYPQHGWPFTLDTSVTYTLTSAGLAVTHSATNVGASEAVFGCGAHPYLRIGEVPTDDLRIRIRAGSEVITDERLIPVGRRPLQGALAALPAGVRLGDVGLDTGFADLEPAPSGRFEHTLTAPDGRTLTMWTDPDFAYTIVFTPRDFPNDTDRGPAGVHAAIAIEPMTCPTNALNSGEGLIRLQPRETWSASWGLTPGN